MLFSTTFGVFLRPLIITLLLLSLSLQLSCSTSISSTAPPQFVNRAIGANLFVDPQSLDLGNIIGMEPLRREIWVLNQGLETITIASFAPTCGCTSTQPTSLQVEANDQGVFSVHLDLSSLASPTMHRTPFAVTLRPQIENAVGPFPQWKMTGEIICPCTIESTQLRFAGAEALVMHRPVTAKRLRCKLWDRDYSVATSATEKLTVVQSPLDDQGEFEVLITPQMAREAGSFTEEVSVTVRDPTGKVVQRIPVQVSGNVEPPYAMAPTQIALGAVPVGQVFSREVHLACRRNQVVGIRSQKPHVEVNLQEGEPTTIHVKIQVTQYGDVSLPIRLTIGDPASQSDLNVELPVTYYGYDLSATVTPTVRSSQ